MIKLLDGREELWQWEQGRIVIVPETCIEVQFSNPSVYRAKRVKVKNGQAIIPDVMLQRGLDLLCWGMYYDDSGNYVEIEKLFKVNEKAKPEDYVSKTYEEGFEDGYEEGYEDGQEDCDILFIDTDEEGNATIEIKSKTTTVEIDDAGNVVIQQGVN